MLFRPGAVMSRMANPLPPAAAAPPVGAAPELGDRDGAVEGEVAVQHVGEPVFQFSAPVEVDAHIVESAPLDRFQRHRGIGDRSVEDAAHPFGRLGEEGVEWLVVLAGLDALPEVWVFQPLEH